MATYKITNVGSGLCLNIKGDNITALTNHQDVTQWKDTGVTEQKWIVDTFLADGPVRSAVDSNFALNILTTTKNCDVFPVASNDATDYTISFFFNDGAYYLILPAYDLYLTAPSSAENASIVWAAPVKDDFQRWVFEEVSDQVSIAPWSWSAVNGQWATAYQTQLAYSAASGKGKVSDFSWRVWNDLCDKVQECLTRAGESWYTYHGPNGSYTPTHAAAKMSETDKTLTAARFNAVRGNIGSHVATGISPVNTGDKVLGSYFLTLVNSINSWISSLNQGG